MAPVPTRSESPIWNGSMLVGFDLHPIFNSWGGYEPCWHSESIGIQRTSARSSHCIFTAVPSGLIIHQRLTGYGWFRIGNIGRINAHAKVKHRSASTELFWIVHPKPVNLSNRPTCRKDETVPDILVGIAAVWVQPGGEEK